MNAFNVPTAHTAQHAAHHFPHTSSIETVDSSGYSRPSYSIDSSGSRTSWSSAEVNWARRGPNPAEEILQRENAELLKQVTIWQAKFETLQMAYNLLLERVPKQSRVESRKLNREDYMQIDYWYKHQWVSLSGNHVTHIVDKPENENDEDDDAEGDAENDQVRSISPAPGTRRGQSRSRAGINVSMCYIQSKDGQVIDGHRAREIRIHARAVFVDFAMQGKQFASWGDADATSRKAFYSEMATRFEELQYCDLDWKAEQIAIDTFPGWKVTWLKKQKKLSVSQQTGSKRACQGSPADKPDSKRLKAVEVSPTLSAASHEAFQVVQQPVPSFNIIPNTPVRTLPTATHLNMQDMGQQLPQNPSLLQPAATHYNFLINNPLVDGNSAFRAASAPPADRFMTTVPSNVIGVCPQQVSEQDSTIAAHPTQNPPAKRARTGTTRMRPSKTSVTPRNLCAHEWAVSNPKGTTDEFSTYFDNLSAEEKQKWEKLSVEAKESGKAPGEIMGLQS